MHPDGETADAPNFTPVETGNRTTDWQAIDDVIAEAEAEPSPFPHLDGYTPIIVRGVTETVLAPISLNRGNIEYFVEQAMNRGFYPQSYAPIGGGIIVISQRTHPEYSFDGETWQDEPPLMCHACGEQGQIIPSKSNRNVIHSWEDFIELPVTTGEILPPELLAYVREQNADRNAPEE